MEPSYLEELQNIISDMYKDVNGIRPRGEQFWAGLDTVDACRAKLEELDIAVGAVIAEDNEREAANLVKVEARIAKLIDVGAHDRDMAIRWLAGANNTLEDIGYPEFLFHVPNGSLGGAA